MGRSIDFDVLMLFHIFQVGLEDGRHTMNLLANLQERLVQSEQGPVVLGTPTSTNTGKIFVAPRMVVIHAVSYYIQLSKEHWAL